MKDSMEDRIQSIVNVILDDVVETNISDEFTEAQPDNDILINIISDLRIILFPRHFGKHEGSGFGIRFQMGDLLDEVYSQLIRQISRALIHSQSHPNMPADERDAKAKTIAAEFISRLPQVREVLKTDIDAGYDGDPAAYSKDEIVFSYPGFFAITVYRLAHELQLLDVPLIPRMMTEYAHRLTGIDIHPGATIGRYFFIDHGTGIVIGETTVIGERVKMYQGVTLGGLSTRAGQQLKGKKRHPTIEDEVTIYSGASILGGETVIGRGATISGNAFVTSSVPAYTRVSVKNPELVFKNVNANACQEKKVELKPGDWDHNN